MLSVEEKTIPVWACVENFCSVQSRTRSSSGSGHVPSLFFFLFSSHRACDIPSPSSGRLVFQFQAGRHLPRPSGICSAAQSALNLNIKRRVSGKTTSVPFFTYISFPFKDLRLWFTPSLLLFWGRIFASVPNMRQISKLISKTSFYPGQIKEKQNIKTPVSVCACSPGLYNSPLFVSSMVGC